MRCGCGWEVGSQGGCGNVGRIAGAPSGNCSVPLFPATLPVLYIILVQAGVVHDRGASPFKPKPLWRTVVTCSSRHGMAFATSSWQLTTGHCAQAAKQSSSCHRSPWAALTAGKVAGEDRGILQGVGAAPHHLQGSEVLAVLHVLLTGGRSRAKDRASQVGTALIGDPAAAVLE